MKLTSTEQAVQEISKRLTQHPDFSKKIGEIENALSEVGFAAWDFQFMFYLNSKTNELKMLLLDVELYEYSFGSDVRNGWQGIDYVMERLKGVAEGDLTNKVQIRNFPPGRAVGIVGGLSCLDRIFWPNQNESLWFSGIICGEAVNQTIPPKRRA